MLARGFEGVFRDSPIAFDYVIHSAPHHVKVWEDVLMNAVEPSSKAILALLTAAHRYGCPSLKRVILTGYVHVPVNAFHKSDNRK